MLGLPEALPIRRYGRLNTPDFQPNLLSLRLSSYQWFLSEGVDLALSRMAPIHTTLPWPISITFHSAEIGEAEFSPEKCWREGLSYDAPFFARARLSDAETGEITDQRIRLGRIPLMTDSGGFVVNGVRRVVIHQIVRAPGAYVSADYDPVSGNLFGHGRIIPERGYWLSVETTDNDVLKCRLNTGGKALSLVSILRVFGLESNEEIVETFDGVAMNEKRDYIVNSILDAAEITDLESAVLELYAEIEPGAPPSYEDAYEAVNKMFFERQRYDLSVVGRKMLNRRYGVEEDGRVLSQADVVRLVSDVMMVSERDREPDDIDNLANRRVRTPGETVFNVLETGLYAMVRETIRHIEMADEKPTRPLDVLAWPQVGTELDGFFSGSKLCQTADETNPIAELTHKRRVTSLGPGGLKRENAGVEPRDVHQTHYGKICPTETPEGQNIGLLGTLTLGGHIDEDGLMTMPVRKVFRSLSSHDGRIAGRTAARRIGDGGESIVLEGGIIGADAVASLAALPEREVWVKPFVLNDGEQGIVFLNAYEESLTIVGQATAEIDELGQILDDTLEARKGEQWIEAVPEEMEYLDLVPKQIISASTSLIPFLDHNDANRALMGCNMQRQAMPLVSPQLPLVGTGSEKLVARDSGYLVLAGEDGYVESVTGEKVVVRDWSGQSREYPLRRMERSNQFTCIDQRPLVSRGEIVAAGDPLADGPGCRDGELALGQRVLVGYMSWGGFNYEDAIIVSAKAVREGKFRSRTVKRFRVAASTILEVGEERFTRDVHDVHQSKLKNLGEDGIVRLGAFVKAGDALVGKETPRLNPVERRLTPEDKLLQRIFGVEENISFIDKSVTLPKGQDGRVISVRVVKATDGTPASRKLDPGCHTYVEVEVVSLRNVQPGDKMSGRHGNKGCVSIVVPEEDMPFLEDGTPLDVLLSPLGVPSRMNLGQLMEVHLGWAAHRMGFRAITEPFDSAKWSEIEQTLAQAWLLEQSGAIARSSLPVSDVHQPDWAVAERWALERGYSVEQLFGQRAAEGTLAGTLCLQMWFESRGYSYRHLGEDYAALRALAIEKDWEKLDPAPITGKQWLRDGQTGEYFERPVMVGYKYMLKLVHMVSDKMYARSTGTYSSITNQPLGGKSKGGGQRMGEMEVWALEGYSAANVLREMLTVKSDDVEGRERMRKAILNSGPRARPADTKMNAGSPDAFWLVVNELRSLGLNVELLNDGEIVPFGAALEPEGQIAPASSELEQMLQSVEQMQGDVDEILMAAQDEASAEVVEDSGDKQDETEEDWSLDRYLMSLDLRREVTGYATGDD